MADWKQNWAYFMAEVKGRPWIVGGTGLELERAHASIGVRSLLTDVLRRKL